MRRTIEEGRLSLAALRHLPPELRPAIDPGALSIGVVHLGVGAFHRAHQVSYLDETAEMTGDARFGVCAFSERRPDAARLLAEQDGLYSLRTASPAGSRLAVQVSLREALFAGDGGAVERIADPDVHLVTITVTEKGYRYEPATGRLRRDDPDVIADAAGGRVDHPVAAGRSPAGAAGRAPGAPGRTARASGRPASPRSSGRSLPEPPRTVLGQLARGLEARRRAEGGPLTVLSCDNLPANGRLLAGLVHELVELRGFDPGLAEWIAEHVSFPCSMVDRIVPAATPHDRELAASILGTLDEAAVVAEPFRQWVIEDDFRGPRPRLELAGVELVPDVAPYETMKLRVLNGPHSALAYLGALSGLELIAESVERFAGFVRTLVDNEVAPTLSLPPGVELDAYRDRVLERFANPVLAHRCLQVASDGSQKLPQRILGTVRDLLRAHGLSHGPEPRRCMLVVAAYLRAVCHGRDESGRPIEVSDPLAPELRRMAAGGPSPERLARRALSIGQLFGEDLASDGRVFRLLAAALADLEIGSLADVISDYS
ncbi:MAG TPA: mannitol dehydrogenase family protein [Acidimicrobiales bacterium]|nr:mannitol dehydrogenase family protein [Acidimicrobiales bacterium]